MIETFKSNIKDLARSNRYKINIPGLSEELSMLCTTAIIPGTSFPSNLNHWQQQGVNAIPWEMPYDVVNNECSLMFLLDDGYKIKTFFDDWMLDVFDPVAGFGYYDEYTKDVKVTQLDRENKPIYTIQLNQAWPKSMADVQLSGGEKDMGSQLTVNLSYASKSVPATPLARARARGGENVSG